MGFRNVSFSAQIRNAISHTNKTARANADTRMHPNVFLRGNLKQKIAIGELGEVAPLKTFFDIYGNFVGWYRIRNNAMVKGFSEQTTHRSQKGPIDGKHFEIVSLRGSANAWGAN